VSYLTQDEIANDEWMQARVAQCAATEGFTPDADAWTIDRRRYWAAAPGWDAAWEYAKNTHPGEPEYEPGKDEAVITDPMILSQVQAMIVAPSP
jgi:hypothetical protein